MRNVYRLCLPIVALLALLALNRSSATAQVLNYPTIPCDSTVCDSIVLTNSTLQAQRIRTLKFRDGISFSIDSALVRPDSIPASGSLAVQICFTPGHRGTITDSLLIVVIRGTRIDSVKIRLTGGGIGPNLSVNPSVLNFPKTNSGSSSLLKMKIANTGERTFTLTAASLTIPPPFRLVTTLPIDILPGDTIEIEVAFEPTADGVYSVPVDLAAGCGVVVRLGLNGATSLIGTGAVLRISKVGFNPSNNEQTTCSVSRCDSVTLSNVGNATLIIDSMAWRNATLGYTVQPPPPLPFLIGPNEQRTIQVCLDSKKRGVLRDTLVVRSNTRNSIAFGLIIDVSRSMDLEANRLNCGANRPKRIDQARIQAQDFLKQTLLYIPSINIQDQIAISRFSDVTTTIFPLTYVTNTSRAAAQTAVQTNTPIGSSTYTGDAIRRMIDTLAKSPLQDRVIVLLTDGAANDTGPSPPSVLTALAKAKKIKIFTIGIGTDKLAGAPIYLRNLSIPTGGAAFDGNNCDSLQQAFESITDIVSRGTVTREPFAIRVIAPLLVSSGGIKFDSVYIHGQKCDSVTLTNIGEGDAVIDRVNFPDLVGGLSSEFTIDPNVKLPLTVPENGQVRLQICFSPNGLRQRGALAHYNYNSCENDEINDSLQGIGYAVAALRINDQRVGLPGSLVTMPVYGDSSLAEYEVNRIIYSVRWNKTMLDLRAVHPGASAPGATVDTVGPIVFGPRDATAQISIVGNGLANAGELAQLEFQVLRGDTLATLVELVKGQFQDGNPKMLLKNAGIVAYDSTCFRSRKGIDAQPASKLAAGDVVPSPTNSRIATLPVTSQAETIVRVQIYSMDGTEKSRQSVHNVHTGANDLPIDLGGLPAGSYYAVVRTAEGDVLFRKIILTN
jgi:Mg-chelatase subunit ChlD